MKKLIIGCALLSLLAIGCLYKKHPDKRHPDKKHPATLQDKATDSVKAFIEKNITKTYTRYPPLPEYCHPKTLTKVMTACNSKEYWKYWEWANQDTSMDMRYDSVTNPVLYRRRLAKKYYKINKRKQQIGLMKVDSMEKAFKPQLVGYELCLVYSYKDGKNNTIDGGGIFLLDTLLRVIKKEPPSM